MSTYIAVSTITPVYAGEKFLEELVNRLDQLRVRWHENDAPLQLVEAIFVDDASVDGSRLLLHQLEQRHPWLRVVELSRNFGQHPATAAGVLHSSGEWLVTLDEDLQHDPTHIEEMLAVAVWESSDLVYANGAGVAHGGSRRDSASRMTKKIVGKIAGNPFVPSFNSFRLIRGPIGRAAASVCSYGTYFDVALCWFTKSISTIPLPLKDIRFVEQSTSNYDLRKLLSHARRLIISSETKIIRLAAALGALAIVVSVIVGLVVLLIKFVHPTVIAVKGWTSLFLAFLFFGGLIVVQLGVVLEYISILVMRALGKPTFFVVDRSSDQVLREYFVTRNQL